MGRQSQSSVARCKARPRRGVSALNEKMYNERPFPCSGGAGWVCRYLHGCIIRKAGTNTNSPAHALVDTHTRLPLRASRPEEGLRRRWGGCVAGCAGYYLPRTVTNARQRHFHSHPQLPTTTTARHRCRSVARVPSSVAATSSYSSFTPTPVVPLRSQKRDEHI